MRAKKLLLLTFLAMSTAVAAQAQAPAAGLDLPRWSLKTNVLYDATSTFNLGAEFRTGLKTSLDVPFSYNPWTFSENKKWKHFLVQPELRFWRRDVFDGSFFGVHAHYANYNAGNLPDPFSDYMKANRFEGMLAGAGVSYGYRWNFNRLWALEATVGVGYAYMSYDRYSSEICGELLEKDGEKHYFGPTKAGITLAYGMGYSDPQWIAQKAGYKAAKKAERKAAQAARVAAQRRPVAYKAPVYRAPAYSAPASAPAYSAAPVYGNAYAPYMVPTDFVPNIQPTFITPEVETVKVRSETGRAYLDFVTGTSEVIPGYRNNAAELQRVYDLLRTVSDNPHAKITSIVITGYTSPEGSYASNLELSERRAMAFKNYLRDIHGLSEGLFTVVGGGEDWRTLDSLLIRSGLNSKYRLQEIINGSDIYDLREQELSKIQGMLYNQIVAGFYPRLRCVEYRINYTISPFTVEKGKEVLEVTPRNLSLNEMFMIANSYTPGSDSFNDVFETAARVFPNSDEANVNAAASALGRKDAVSAARYLDRVKDVNGIAYRNNMGVLAWLQGDNQKASVYFSEGGALGAGNASELKKYMQTINE